MSDEGKALVVTQALVPAIVFAPGGVDAILSKIKAEVAAVEIDISTGQIKTTLGCPHPG